MCIQQHLRQIIDGINDANAVYVYLYECRETRTDGGQRRA